MIELGLHTLDMTFTTHGTFWLMSDVGRGSSAAPRSGHDVTGPDINLDFSDAHFGCTARLGSRDMAPDRCPTEKQAPAGQLAGFGALRTHKAGRSAFDSCQWCSRADRRYTDSTGHDCHCDQQKRGGGPRHCISCHRLRTTRFARADPELNWFVHVQPCNVSGRPGDAPKRY